MPKFETRVEKFHPTFALCDVQKQYLGLRGCLSYLYTIDCTIDSFSSNINLTDCLWFLPGWLYGIKNGVVGLFPAEYVKPIARHEIHTVSSTLQVKLGHQDGPINTGCQDDLNINNADWLAWYIFFSYFLLEWGLIPGFGTLWRQ